MNLLQFFDNIWLQNILLCLVVFYLLIAIVYAAHFSSCERFDKPVLLSSFNLFSSFFFSLILIVFCFDFITDDKLYFFNQNFQLLFLFFIICVSFASYDFLTKKIFLSTNMTCYSFLLFLVVFVYVLAMSFFLYMLLLNYKVLLYTYLQLLIVILNSQLRLV